MTTTILNSMAEVNAALCKGQRVTAYFHVGAFGRSCSEANVKRVVNGVAIANFGYDGDSVGLRFSDAKQWVAYDRLKPAGKPLTVEVDPTLKEGEWRLSKNPEVVSIGSSEEQRKHLDRGFLPSCGIDLAKPKNEQPPFKQETIPFIGGPNDGKFYAMAIKSRCVDVPVKCEPWTFHADDYSERVLFKTVRYLLRDFAGVSVYAPVEMTDQEVMVKLIEGYGVKRGN